LADSQTTKTALATSLKNLMKVEQFSKISVGEICKECSMNRKSFYYHFKDKYDLMTWIFRSEFAAHTDGKEYSDIWEAFEDLCVYLHANRAFYKKALAIKGQNSFSEFFKEQCLPSFVNMMISQSSALRATKFSNDFFADAIICSIERWLREQKDVSPHQFIVLLSTCFE